MFNRPSLSDLITRTRNDIFSRLDLTDPLRRADAEVYARAIAGVGHGLYGYLDWLSKQFIYDTAESDILDRWASIWLTVPRKGAASAVGSVSWTVQLGAAIPALSSAYAPDGTLYQTTADAVVVGTTATTTVAAIVPGAAGNKLVGQVLTLSSPLNGVQPAGVAAALTGGADIESDDDLRFRLITRIQQPPHGGASFDYVNWALEVPGVTRAWVYPKELGAGTVTVRFVRDNDPTGFIPDAAEIAAVYGYILARCPVTVDLYVTAPIAAPINFVITLTPLTATVETAVINELTDMIFREASPGSTILLSHIREAISIATGETNNIVTAPAADVVNGTGYIATVGSFTWS